MESERRKFKRRPLSDCTNTPHRSLAKPPKPQISTTLKLNETNTGSNPNEQHPALQTLPFTPPPRKSPAIFGDADHEDSKITAAFCQRQTRAKSENKKTVSVATTKTKDNGKTASSDSFPSPRRLRNTGDELDIELGGIHNPDNDANLNKEQRVAGLPVTDLGSNDAGYSTPQTQIFTSMRPKSPSKYADVEDHKSEVNTVNRRRTVRKTKAKGKADLADPGKTKVKGKADSFVTLSCPPGPKNIWYELDKRQEDVDKLCRELGESHKIHTERGADSYVTRSVPRAKKKKHQHELSKDFIEQQRAYFAEIDAFELPVEAVSDSELE